MLAILFAVAAALPRYWSVHIDVPAQRAEFERIDREQARLRHDILVAHNIEPLPAFEISTADGKFMSFRPRQTMSEFDRPSSIPDEVRAEIQKKAGVLDDTIHRTLREHHNEIWELQRVPTRVDSRRAPKYIRLRTDSVKPGSDRAYEAAMKRIADDCEKRGISVLAFWSAYGDGTYRTLFMSDTPVRVERLRGLVRSTREVDATARPDLTATDAENWLPF
jgi:hypothetical protein